MSEKPEILQIPIDPDGRYLLVVKGLSCYAFIPIKEQFDKWWQSGAPVLMVSVAPDVEIEFMRINDEQSQN